MRSCPLPKCTSNGLQCSPHILTKLRKVKLNPELFWNLAGLVPVISMGGISLHIRDKTGKGRGSFSMVFIQRKPKLSA